MNLPNIVVIIGATNRIMAEDAYRIARSFGYRGGTTHSLATAICLHTNGEITFIDGVDYSYYQEHEPFRSFPRVNMWLPGWLKVWQGLMNGHWSAIKPELLNLINHSPDSEMVAGFIRRDHNLVLPPEVQAQGSQAILDWVQSQAPAVAPPAVKAAPAAEETRFRIIMNVNVTGSTYWDRYDRVTYEGTVPPEVMRQALEENDPDIIGTWLSEHTDELDELNRSRGNQEWGEDNGEPTEELMGMEESNVASQFERIQEQQPEPEPEE